MNTKKELAPALLGALLLCLASSAISQNDNEKPLTPSSSVGTAVATSSADNTADSRNAPIEIEADSAEQNETLGTIIYRGNVVIKQVDLSIQAEKVTISSSKVNQDGKRQLNTIIATGEPASFTHNPTIETQAVYAQAETITFNVARNLVQLEKNAQLNQNQSSVQGNSISYDINKRRVNANSDNDSNNTKQRVKTIISPDGNLLPQIR